MIVSWMNCVSHLSHKASIITITDKYLQMCLTYTVYYNSHRHYTSLSLFLLVCRLLSGEELPDSSAVELITEGVQHGVEDRRRLGQHRQYLEDLQTHDLSSQGKTLKMFVFSPFWALGERDWRSQSRRICTSEHTAPSRAAALSEANLC